MEDIKKILLVEGNDDRHVIYALRQLHAIPNTFSVQDCHGIDGLLSELPIRIKNGTEKIGVIVDADTSIGDRWTAITDILDEAGYDSIPAKPDPLGTIISPSDPDLPEVGIWLMPNNSSNGMLEDFIRFLVPRGDKLIGLATQAIDNIPATDRLFIESHQSKAQIFTWLAWQSTPGRPLGNAITYKFLDPQASQAKDLAAWMTKLLV